MIGDKRDALETYAIAKDYGFDRPLLDERMKLCKQQVKDQQIKREKQIAKPQVKIKSTSPLSGILISITLVILLLLFLS